MKFWNTKVVSVLALVALAAAEPLPPGKPPKSASTPSVKFKIQDRWVPYDELQRQAREYLRKKGIVPPEDDSPSYEIFPKKTPGAFVGIRYGHRFGKPAWYISFSSEGRIIDYDTWIVNG